MSLRNRIAQLERQQTGTGKTLYVFGEDAADLEQKIAEVRHRYPMRPVMGFRWREQAP